MGIFDEIYSHDNWGFGSGHGSLPRVTKGYRKFLETFIDENKITSVVDYGCGDWQFSKLINWGKVNYTGVDVVPAVVKENNEKYATRNIKFKVLKEGVAPPKADLIIVKDVLQHLSHDAVQDFIKNVLPNYKYALVVNCIDPEKDINAKIDSGGFRPLDLRLKPFNVDAKVVYTFSGPKVFSMSQKRFFPSWKKLVLLVG